MCCVIQVDPKAYTIKLIDFRPVEQISKPEIINPRVENRKKYTVRWVENLKKGCVEHAET